MREVNFNLLINNWILVNTIDYYRTTQLREYELGDIFVPIAPNDECFDEELRRCVIRILKVEIKNIYTFCSLGSRVQMIEDTLENIVDKLNQFIHTLDERACETSV